MYTFISLNIKLQNYEFIQNQYTNILKFEGILLLPP